MILEWIDSLLVTTPGRAVRRLGYAREAAALEARHRRCRAAWSEHLCATQSALLHAADRAANRHGTALVVGAGVIHDISLQDLLACFGAVWLVDLAFTRQTRASARAMGPRVRCLQADVSGVIGVLSEGRAPLSSIPLPNRLPLPLPENLAWIASVNCLTQLPLIPAARLIRLGRSDAEVEAFGRTIMVRHIEMIGSAGVPACLISEIEDSRWGLRGRILEKTDYRPVLEPVLESHGATSFAQWDWPVHPPGELPGGESELRRVVAWELPGQPQGR
jgi:hypothetical protein